MESNERRVSSAQVEKILDGNICRCTGYRPILDAFKSLATDPSDEIRSRCVDIEVVKGRKKVFRNTMITFFEDAIRLFLFKDTKTFPCTFNFTGCKAECGKRRTEERITIGFKNGEKWVAPSTVAKILEVLHGFQATQAKYRLVAGNTGTGTSANSK